MKKSLIILFILIAVSAFAQKTQKPSGLNCEVLGIVINGGNYFLNTDQGLVKINNEDDPFEEYYRKIYNDSTIVNPNTELKSAGYNSAINFFNPAIDISQWAEEYNTFGNKLYLYDFMEVDENGNYNFKPGIIGLVQKELSKKKNK